MKVFISWSGDLSRQVAEILREFLPYMIQDLQVFMSEHDMPSGVRWGLQLAKQLENSEFGIICLTPDNLQSPWLLYEAGALTKHIEDRACGLLLNRLKISEVKDPLAQFHNRPFEKSEFKKLLRDVNSRVSNPLNEQQLQRVFEKWWPDLQQQYDELLKKSVSNPKIQVQRDEKDLLEEILMKVRGLERRLETSSAFAPARSSDAMFSEIMDALNDNQRQLLRELIYSSLQEKTVGKENIERMYSQQDLQRLKKMGLVEETGEGIKITDDFKNVAVKRYLSVLNRVLPPLGQTVLH